MKKPRQTSPTDWQKLSHKGDNLYRSDSSKIYYAIFRRGRKQIRRSLKTTDLDLARRRLADLRLKIKPTSFDAGKSLFFAEYDTRPRTKEKVLTGGLAKLWLDYHTAGLRPKSRVMYSNSVKMLAPHFKDVTVRNIDLRHVQAWAGSRANSVSARTFNVDLLTLQQILDHAVEHGYLLDNPARRIKRLKSDRKPLLVPTQTQFKQLLDDMRSNQGKRDAAASADLVEFLAYSGCRISEVVGEDIDPSRAKSPMCWGQIDLTAKTFVVKDPKNHEARTVPLFPPLLRLLDDMRYALPTPPKSTDHLFTIKTATRALTSATRRLGLPHFSHHTFRHFFCSNAIEVGIDFKVIAGWLGHKDGGVLVAKTYGHLRDEHSAAMAKKMTFDAAAETPTPSKTTARKSRVNPTV